MSFIERSRKAAKASYEEIYAFHSGTRDKYIYTVHSWGFVLSYLVMSAAFAVAGVVKTGTNSCPYGSCAGAARTDDWAGTG